MNQLAYLCRLTNYESFRVLLCEVVPYRKPTQARPDEASRPLLPEKIGFSFRAYSLSAVPRKREEL